MERNEQREPEYEYVAWSVIDEGPRSFFAIGPETAARKLAFHDFDTSHLVSCAAAPTVMLVYVARRDGSGDVQGFRINLQTVREHRQSRTQLERARGRGRDAVMSDRHHQRGCADGRCQICWPHVTTKPPIKEPDHEAAINLAREIIADVEANGSSSDAPFAENLARAHLAHTKNLNDVFDWLEKRAIENPYRIVTIYDVAAWRAATKVNP